MRDATNEKKELSERQVGKARVKAAALLGVSALSIVVGGFRPATASAQQAGVPPARTTNTVTTALPQAKTAQTTSGATDSVAPSPQTSATAPAQTASSTRDPELPQPGSRSSDLGRARCGR